MHLAELGEMVSLLDLYYDNIFSNQAEVVIVFHFNANADANELLRC